LKGSPVKIGFGQHIFLKGSPVKIGFGQHIFLKGSPERHVEVEGMHIEGAYQF
jgi:hypothetical protein